ncbi:hypothetical protein DTO166G4_685 [Paecilomyces variotii]|uniref:Eukaryotic translation initiation factor 2A n=1 Tax=Byssochlamys spectabilis TaxID=264951 RepID=A0A443I4H8_BYSSP|nr:putative eukaryotic translation initiation factor subunit eIF2A [Paecilomyces variotii]KAJ9191752.1 hypothetical protein DTO032I3_8674 [Paecilomyces variotii]KAJ9205010.1 hypothetical protein DTO164E3_1633 [Paecilomyces variotii]KAJ9217503.1 hypothetical protein DTO166G4_685 [Paecilomyces variotii]KAJ9226556.1 hypothetical protein DTO169C6_1284 [Paecilomyces variotii]KAJ9230066.1 hypothetical protein DTO169E5_8587 [Paecilomyces variotii]
MAAPTQFAFRTLKGIGIVDAAPVYEPLPGFTRPEGNLRCCSYSPCGRYFAWASPERVTIVDPSVGHVITTLPAENVYELGFSPLGTYAITWQRPGKDENGDAVKNLKVWRVIEGSPESDEHAIVGRFVQKSQTGWNLQYTADEKFCARVVTNEIQFFQSNDLSNVWNKLRVEGVVDFALSPGKSHSIAVFVPERKGQPAAVKVFSVPQFGAPVSQKNFFKGDKVQLKWNNSGTTLIVLAQTEVDKTGKSYYGETTLYLLSATGAFDSRVDLDKEGPIHDVAWSPNSKEFGVVYGYMPAKTTIFNFRGKPVQNFPLAPRNTILFSPHGRFVLVAGFGNLAGQTDIYDVEKDYRKVATIEASNASVCEWSPDGKYILTATTSPRLRVDNGVRIWHVGGGLMYNEDMNELYEVCWRPQSTIQHPLVGDPLNPVPTPHASALAYLSTRKAPTKPAGAYRPPGARGQGTPLAFKREDEGGAAYVRDGAPTFGGVGANGFGKPRRREVPGAEPVEFLPPGAAPGGGVTLPPGAEEKPLSKTAAKNKKKREAKKLKEEAEGATEQLAPPNGQHASVSPDRRSHSRSRSNAKGRDRKNSTVNGAPTGPSKQNAKANGAAAPAPAPPAEAESPTTPGGGNGTPQEKKIRGLLKKIRAIDDLKMRLAGGEKLEDTQMKKIRTEDSVRKELESLGYNG